MAYKALYRTYRPSSFDEVYGQQHIVQTLKHAVEQNKIAHAYLFCGPRGTGKTSIAKIFAKTINCTGEHKPCMACDNCLAVQDGSHPDIIEIDAASNNGVEEVRNLIEKVKYAPLKGKYKVYIIDEVHMMSTGAFNALLKTIEEPPAHVIFIMATTEPHKVLPTIISRCQRFDFTKISQKEIENRLKDVLEKEHIAYEEEVVRIIAQLADGGMRDALSILDQCIAYAQNDLKVHHINEIYGITTIKEKIELLDLIASKDASTLMNKIDAFIEKGIDIKRLTMDLVDLLKETIIFEYTKDSNLLTSMSGEEVNHLLDLLTRQRRFQMIHSLMETYDKYRNAANVGSYFEVCVLEMLDDRVVVSEPQVMTQSTKPVQPVVTQNVSRETLQPKPEVKKNVLTPKVQEKPVLEEQIHEKPVLESFEMEDDGNYEILLEGLEPQQTEPIEVEKPVQEKKAIRPLEDEYVLGLLAGANKPEKNQDIACFLRIDDMMMDIKWAKSGSLLKHSTIVGSGRNYIVVSVDNQAEANAINELDSKNEFYDFIQELLGKNKKIFAISKDAQRRIIQAFKERMLAGTLPQPVVVENVTIQKEQEKEMTQEETILDLFGKDNIVVTEE